MRDWREKWMGGWGGCESGVDALPQGTFLSLSRYGAEELADNNSSGVRGDFCIGFARLKASFWW
jgi:hypothetical protein